MLNHHFQIEGMLTKRAVIADPFGHRFCNTPRLAIPKTIPMFMNSEKVDRTFWNTPLKSNSNFESFCQNQNQDLTKVYFVHSLVLGWMKNIIIHYNLPTLKWKWPKRELVWKVVLYEKLQCKYLEDFAPLWWRTIISQLTLSLEKW